MAPQITHSVILALSTQATLYVLIQIRMDTVSFNQVSFQICHSKNELPERLHSSRLTRVVETRGDATFVFSSRDYPVARAAIKLRLLAICSAQYFEKIDYSFYALVSSILFL